MQSVATIASIHPVSLLVAIATLIGGLWAAGRYLFWPRLGKAVRDEMKPEIDEIEKREQRIVSLEVSRELHDARIKVLESAVTVELREIGKQMASVVTDVAVLRERTAWMERTSHRSGDDRRKEG